MSQTVAKVHLGIIILTTIAFLWVTMPSSAHAATPPPPPKEDKPVVLKIYPKLLPIQQGEEVIRDRRAKVWDHMEDSPPPGFLRYLDSRTWA